MERIVRIAHFTRDSSKAKAVEVLMVRPTTNQKGYIDEGRVVLMFDDGNNRVGIQLSISEASLLYQRLGYALDVLAEDFHNMSKQRKPATSNSNSNSSRRERDTQKEVDNEDELSEFDREYSDMG